jgi:hypothetical protein
VRKGASSILSLRHAEFRPVVGNSYVQNGMRTRIGGRHFDTRRHLASSARGLGDRNRELRFARCSVNKRLCFAGVAADESESPVTTKSYCSLSRGPFRPDNFA